MAQAHSNWQYLGASGFVGAYTTTGGGGSMVTGRDQLDESRMGIGKIPSAEYPDGYLGNIRSRRDDKGKPYAIADTVLDSLRNRQNQRAYQRGVHKGERIDAAQYYWPPELRPDSRVRIKPKVFDNEGSVNMMVPRYAPKTELAPNPHLVNDGKANIKAMGPAELNPRVIHQYAHLRPSWN
jgi:hypothetical protein